MTRRSPEASPVASPYQPTAVGLPVPSERTDGNLGGPIEFIELAEALKRRRAEHDLEQLLNERRLGDLLALGERTDECFHLRRDTTLDECVGWHVSDRVTKAAGCLSCI